MLGLPKTTPTAAVMYVTGSLFASIRVQTKQLVYLQKVLKKNEGHWTRKTLETLQRHDIGWAKQIQDNLREWGLEMDWDIIRAKENGRD